MKSWGNSFEKTGFLGVSIGDLIARFPELKVAGPCAGFQNDLSAS